MILMIIIALIIWGCGDDGDSSKFTGMYEMTEIREVTDGCAEADLVTVENFGDLAFFRVKLDSFFGQNFLTLSGCNSGTDCSNLDDDTIYMTDSFSTSGKTLNDVWCYGSGTTGTECHCNYNTKTLTLVDGILTWENRTQNTTITIPEGDKCEDHEKDDMTFTCSSLKISTAKKLD